MSQNPFESPQFDQPAIGILSGTREDLRKVAEAQRAVMTCILAYFICGIASAVLRQNLQSNALISLGIGVVYLVAVIFAFINIFKLAVRVYGAGAGVVLGVLTLIPCVGLIVLLIVNGKATKVLRQNGISVGLMGANMSDFKS